MSFLHLKVRDKSKMSSPATTTGMLSRPAFRPSPASSPSLPPQVSSQMKMMNRIPNLSTPLHPQEFAAKRARFKACKTDTEKAFFYVTELGYQLHKVVKIFPGAGKGRLRCLLAENDYDFTSKVSQYTKKQNDRQESLHRKTKRGNYGRPTASQHIKNRPWSLEDIPVMVKLVSFYEIALTEVAKRYRIHNDTLKIYMYKNGYKPVKKAGTKQRKWVLREPNPIPPKRAVTPLKFAPLDKKAPLAMHPKQAGSPSPTTKAATFAPLDKKAPLAMHPKQAGSASRTPKAATFAPLVKKAPLAKHPKQDLPSGSRFVSKPVIVSQATSSTTPKAATQENPWADDSDEENPWADEEEEEFLLAASRAVLKLDVNKPSATQENPWADDDSDEENPWGDEEDEEFLLAASRAVEKLDVKPSATQENPWADDDSDEENPWTDEEDEEFLLAAIRAVEKLDVNKPSEDDF